MGRFIGVFVVAALLGTATPARAEVRSFFTMYGPVPNGELPAKPRVLDLRIDLEKLAAPRPWQFELAPAEQADEEQAVFELNDSTAEGDWARQQDFELVVTWEAFALAVNNHLLMRNVADAQVVASFALDF